MLLREDSRNVPVSALFGADEAIRRLANTVHVTDDVLASNNSCELGEHLGLLFPKMLEEHLKHSHCD